MEKFLYLIGLILTVFLGGWIDGRIVLDEDFKWKADDSWSPCSAEVGHCGHGVKTRDVYCFDTITRKIQSPDFCYEKPKPNATEDCYVPCHEDAKLEWKFSEWEPCELLCNSPECKNDELQSVKSDEENEVIPTGIQRRTVSCILVSGTILEEPVIDYNKCAAVLPKPVTVQECEITEKCVTTKFTEWSLCCDGFQYRTRSIFKSTNIKSTCPELKEFKTCTYQDPKCSDTSNGYHWYVGDWKKCGLKNNTGIGEIIEDSELHYPQIGIQKRTVQCRDGNDNIVGNSLCAQTSPQPDFTKMCAIDNDCQISGEPKIKIIRRGCVAKDSLNKIYSEKLLIRRNITVAHTGNGLPCPKPVEKLYKGVSKNTMLPECSEQVKWQYSKWSDCVDSITKVKVECGGGVQYRNLTCVDVRTGRPLVNWECNGVAVPPVSQRCEVACPRDCQIGEWSKWSPCLPMECYPEAVEFEHTLSGYRKRFRNVEVPPSDFGMECPSLSEVQPCKGTKCFTWSTGVWGSCQLLDQSSKLGCGPGKRTRQAFCITHQKEIVDEYKCRFLGKPILEENCHLPCPFDCVTSAWSDWSPCSQECSSETSKGVRYRNRTIVGHPGPDGVPCPKPKELSEEEYCNEHFCYSYYWLALPWNECNGTCDDGLGGDGIQKREVLCFRNDDGKVLDKYCKPLSKPAVTRPCRKECIPECRLSEWSDWSPCPSDCPTVYSKISAEHFPFERVYRRRTRISVGGYVCGPLEEIEICPSVNKKCPVYEYRVGKWSECQLPLGPKCGDGLRNRELRCMSVHDGEFVPMHMCYNTNATLRLPETVQKCNVDCRTSCVVTDWSPWSKCTNATIFKIRTRELIGGPDKNLCRYLKLKEKLKCPSDDYKIRLSNLFSSCILNNRSDCGFGQKYAAWGCYLDGKPVESGFCGIEEPKYEIKPCKVECPIDCEVDEWTEWGECSSKCGPGMHSRERRVIQAPLYGGRKCPEIFQQKPCDHPCSDFQWQTNPGTCEIDQTNELIDCGFGILNREIWCTNAVTGTTVPDEYCDWVTRPESNAKCQIGCPGDCLLGEWSEWSTCKKCGEGEIQRTRSLLRMKDNSSGLPCFDAIESAHCQTNLNCFNYHWTTTPFSSCLALGGSPCGEGVMSRKIFCQRSDGRAVDDSFCEHQRRDWIGPGEEKWCYIECPIDCEYGEWGQWDMSACTCEDAKYGKRERNLLVSANVPGRQCIGEKVQQMPCIRNPCYEWNTTIWEYCKLGEATCGYGYTERKVTCQNLSGEEFPDEYCEDKMKPIEKETCFVPCDEYCALGPWSEWSECLSECSIPVPKNYTVQVSGYQTRRREFNRLDYFSMANRNKTCPDAISEYKVCIDPSKPAMKSQSCNPKKEERSLCKIKDGSRCDCPDHKQREVRDGMCVVVEYIEPLTKKKINGDINKIGETCIYSYNPAEDWTSFALVFCISLIAFLSTVIGIMMCKYPGHVFADPLNYALMKQQRSKVENYGESGIYYETKYYDTKTFDKMPEEVKV